MPVKAQASGIIDHPVSKVFQFHAVEHVQNHPRWDPNIQLDHLTDGPMAVGKKIKRINSRSGQPVEGSMEVTEFELNRVITMLIHDGPVKLIARATYEAEGEEKTLLTMNIEFPDLDQMDTEMLVTAMQGSIRNINQLLLSEV
ncbi:MAG TPA: hypothetical protein VLA72_17720 [Anaerolineales bacterium]|nr:hypothetical protein [Anaerolineales bacterium]